MYNSIKKFVKSFRKDVKFKANDLGLYGFEIKLNDNVPVSYWDRSTCVHIGIKMTKFGTFSKKDFISLKKIKNSDIFKTKIKDTSNSHAIELEIFAENPQILVENLKK